MPHPSLDRVAEILVSDDPSGTHPEGRSDAQPGSGTGAHSFGSGYRLGRRLVLTAAHLLAAGQRTAEVRVGLGGGWLPAQVVWRARAGGPDMALLALPAAAARLAPDELRLGHLPAEPARRVEVTATGFPAFAATGDDGRPPVRDTSHLTGTVASHGNRKALSLELHRHDRPQTRGAQWSGMSGAAVFAHGALIGVVTAADTRDAPLYAASLELLARPDGDPEQAAEAAEFWRLVAGDGLDPYARPAQRRTAYADYVRRQAERVGGLRDRADELAAVHEFARAGAERPHHLWLVAPPWAGKSALAACAVAAAPPDVDAVTFFVSRSTGAQTPQFLREVCDQLAALLDEERPPEAGPAQLDDLWQRALARADLLGRHLLLTVDGLDENDSGPPIAALIPQETGAHGHILLLSRHLPPLPPELPPEHPLRNPDRCPRTELTPSPYAGELRLRATADLTGLLRDPVAHQVLGMLAAAGPMTVDELAELLPVGRFAVEDVTLSAPARVLAPAADAHRFAYGHEQLRRTVRDRLGESALREHLAAVHAWADRYAGAGWPDDTPAYLLLHYPAVLADPESRDSARLAALPDRERLALWQRRSGHDADATAELTAVLAALATATDEEPDLAAVCVLAERRYRLVGGLRTRDFAFPPEIPVAWARQGQWQRAEHQASYLTYPLAAFAGIARVAADGGDAHRFRHFVTHARKAAAAPGAHSVRTARYLAELSLPADAFGDIDLMVELLNGARDIILRHLDTDKAVADARRLAWAASCVTRVGVTEWAATWLGHAVGGLGTKIDRQLIGRLPHWEHMLHDEIRPIAAAFAPLWPDDVRRDPLAAARTLRVEHPHDMALALTGFAHGLADEGPPAGPADTAANATADATSDATAPLTGFAHLADEGPAAGPADATADGPAAGSADTAANATADATSDATAPLTGFAHLADEDPAVTADTAAGTDATADTIALLTAAADLLTASAAAGAPPPRMVTRRDASFAWSLSITAAAVALAAAELGAAALAARMTDLADAYGAGTGDPETDADTWHRLATAYEATGRPDRADELLGRITRAPEHVAALVDCADAARTPQRAAVLLHRADQLVLRTPQWEGFNNEREDLVAAVARHGDPARAEQIATRLGAAASSGEGTTWLITVLTETGEHERARQAVALLAPKARDYGRGLLEARPTSAAELNAKRPDRIGPMLEQAEEAAGSGDRAGARQQLQEAVDFAPQQAVGPYKIGLQYARVGVAAVGLGETAVAEQILKHVRSRHNYPEVCVPLQAAVATAAAERGEQDRAVALLTAAHEFHLAHDEGYGDEPIDALYTAAAAVDRRLGSRMLVQALARVPNARRYLPQAVRLDAALAPLILNLHRQGP